MRSPASVGLRPTLTPASRSASILAAAGDVLTETDTNHHLLSRLLRRKADLVEIPVQFFPMSPALVRRPKPLDGLRAIGIIIRHRLASGS